MLMACDRFETLDMHAANICRDFAFGAYQINSVRQQLESFARNKLLQSCDDVIQICCASADEPPHSIFKVTSLGIPTRNRPELVARALRSYAQASRADKRDIRFIIADDSDVDSHSVRAALSVVTKEHSISISLVTKPKRIALVGEIVKRSGVSETTARFGLLNDDAYPVAIGMNRNMLLLASAGELTIQADDDTVCATDSEDALSREQLTLTSKYDPTEFWFDPVEDFQNFESDSIAEETLAAQRYQQFFSKHESSLGVAISQLIRTVAKEQLHCDDITSAFLKRAQCANAKVVVSALGSRGDSGASGPLLFLRLDDQSRARLLASESTYNHALQTHSVTRRVSHRTISDGTFCSGLNLGLDNRDILPPFLPVQRNEDGVFAALVRSATNGYFSFEPATILHQRKRTSFETLEGRASKIESGDIMELIVSSINPVSDGPTADRLIEIGNRLIEIGSLSGSKFKSRIRHLVWSRALSNIKNLEELLTKYNDGPDFWARDVRRFCEIQRQALLNKNCIVPADLQICFGEDVAATMMQRLVVQFGELLVSWPSMYQVARELHDEGWQLPGGRGILG